MFRYTSVLLALVLAALAPSTLRAQDKLVLFGGYSYLRPPITTVSGFVCTGTICPANPVADVLSTSRQNLNGWELTATYRFLPFLGIAADVSGHYGSAASSSSSSAHQYTYLFGPEVSLPRRVSPFAHVLFGGTHQSVTSSPIYPPLSSGFYSVIPTTTSAFATAIGAGIDLKLVPHVWIRPIQLDYLITRLGSNTQNQARVSAGVVFHF